MSNRIIRIATRKSDLAMTQTKHVAALFEEKTGLKTELVPISSGGDKDRTTPLAQFGGVGIFIKELEKALADDRADLAVHSLKDVPSFPDERLTLCCFPERVVTNDVLVTAGKTAFAALDPAKPVTIATGSPRRQLQLGQFFRQAAFVPIRGNVGTRIEKLHEGLADATVLAAAGLMRLGNDYHDPAYYIPHSVSLPPAGQGALVLQCRADDREVLDATAKLNDKAVEMCVRAERSLMRTLEGGCQLPLGVLAVMNNSTLVLEAACGSVSQNRMVRLGMSCRADEGEDAGARLAENIRELMKADGIEPG